MRYGLILLLLACAGPAGADEARADCQSHVPTELHSTSYLALAGLSGKPLTPRPAPQQTRLRDRLKAVSSTTAPRQCLWQARAHQCTSLVTSG